MRAYIHTAPSRSKGISKIAGSRIPGGDRLLHTPPINTNDQTRFVQSCTHGQADNAICKYQCRVQIPYTYIHLEALAYGKKCLAPRETVLPPKGQSVSTCTRPCRTIPQTPVKGRYHRRVTPPTLVRGGFVGKCPAVITPRFCYKNLGRGGHCVTFAKF